MTKQEEDKQLEALIQKYNQEVKVYNEKIEHIEYNFKTEEKNLLTYEDMQDSTLKIIRQEEDRIEQKKKEIANKRGELERIAITKEIEEMIKNKRTEDEQQNFLLQKSNQITAEIQEKNKRNKE